MPGGKRIIIGIVRPWLGDHVLQAPGCKPRSSKRFIELNASLFVLYIEGGTIGSDGHEDIENISCGFYLAFGKTIHREEYYEK